MTLSTENARNRQNCRARIQQFGEKWIKRINNTEHNEFSLRLWLMF